jgi:hypothetical protein
LKEEDMSWIDSRNFFLKPKQANFIFEYDDNKSKQRTINLRGSVKYETSEIEKEFFLEATEVGEDYLHDVISAPSMIDKSKNEDVIRHGIIILSEPSNEFVKEESIEIKLLLKPKEFERLVYFTDKSFFSSNATMAIVLSVVELEQGSEQEGLQGFPSGELLPVVGYKFSINKWI